MDLQKQFSKAYDKNAEKIFRFVFLKVGAREVAEDIASQVFSKAWAKVRTGTKVDNMSAYFYQIARAEVANFYRKKAKMQIVSADESTIVDSGANVEQAQQKIGEMEGMRNVLTSLNEDCQDVLVWRYLEDYSIGKIAKIKGKSNGAIRVMIHRALRELREKMGQK